ncbi:hypothetical protein [Streptomyces fuscichromogenes]|uniref:Aminoglycoside phosphotransferase domain-containing protein n=1 Tax=Streptomyces fuscichromogenes TaxID=1324013 RepID=A0A917XQS2_9ACTN|nr:hypothetical protein [Streptomyces fuscichromogenes]GGN46426.1 hypothetical protein GCM10011578_099320 [Streptomyces fuscichromogenes]
MESILRAAGGLLDVELSGPVDLGGSSRSTVLRCETAAGDSVIVKAFSSEPESLRCFTAEAAALSLGIAGPELLGVDPDVPLLVMADLGNAPTLADILLGSDPTAAESGLLAWARTLGRLAAESVHRRADLARLWSRYHKGMPSWEDEPWIAQRVTALPALLDGAGIAVPAGFAEELTRIGTAGGEEYPAFTPGDTCPDNNLLTPEGLRLIDFEAACYQSVFLTAAYCRMPFSSCWCVFTLPAGTAAEIEQAYRAEVVGVYLALAEDEVWQAGMRPAVAVWTVDATVRLLPRAVVGAGHPHSDGRLPPEPTPAARALALDATLGAANPATVPLRPVETALLHDWLQQPAHQDEPGPPRPCARHGPGASH